MYRSSSLKDSLKSVEWLRSGDSLGSYYCASVKRKSETETIISIVSEPYAGAEREEAEYLVSADVFNNIGIVIENHDMLNWGDLEDEKYFALDAATVKLYIKGEGYYLQTDSNKMWPSPNAVTEIKNIIEEEAKKGTQINLVYKTVEKKSYEVD